MINRKTYNQHLDEVLLNFFSEGFNLGVLNSLTINSIIQARYGFQFHLNELEASLKRLSRNNFFEEIEDPFTGSHFFPNYSVISKHCESEKNVKKSITWKCENIDSYIPIALSGMLEAEILEDNSVNTDELKSSDDTWEPLPLERSGSKFEEAVAGIEEIIKQVRESNGYASSAHEERENILTSLQTGLKQLKDGFITHPQIQILLIQPINFLVNKFTEGAIVEAGKKALQVIFNLIGN